MAATAEMLCKDPSLCSSFATDVDAAMKLLEGWRANNPEHMDSEYVDTVQQGHCQLQVGVKLVILDASSKQ